MKYVKKPVVVEAVQWANHNTEEILAFCPVAIARFVEASYGARYVIIIPTLEGDHTVSYGDYVIKGVHGEFYPCKPDIFAETYETVEENDND